MVKMGSAPERGGDLGAGGPLCLLGQFWHQPMAGRLSPLEPPSPDPRPLPMHRACVPAMTATVAPQVDMMPFFSLLTFRNSAMLEKYFWLASATFFSAACGFTISRPWGGAGDRQRGGQVAWLLTPPPQPRVNRQSGQTLGRGRGFPGTWSGVKATLEAVPEERSRMVDFPPYTTLCFCRVRCGGEGRPQLSPGLCSHVCLTPPTQAQPYLERLGDPGFSGLVHLRLPHTPTARLAQVAQAEAQVLLVGIFLDLGEWGRCPGVNYPSIG